MNRKNFLAAVSAAAITVPAGSHTPVLPAIPADPRIPSYLSRGDTIGITSCAGYITLQEIQPAFQLMQDWGFRIVIGDTIGKRDHTFGGTDEERRDDMQRMLDDPSIKAIMCARGGYGAVRIIDSLDFSTFVAHPKWIIGFSDITVIHAHLNRIYGVASLHAKMCNSFPNDWSKAEPEQAATILSIRQALTGEKMQYTVVPHPANHPGIAEGTLVGGNLKTLESIAGSPSALTTDGKILFVEDTGEYLYSIDRMFWGLKRSGRLDQLSGLIIGGFRIKPDDSPDEAFGKNLQEIILEKISGYPYPVCFDFPVGHQKNNYALKCGVRHRLQVAPDAVTLIEI